MNTKNILSKEFEALNNLIGRNTAVLADGRTVYLTPTGEVRDMDTRLLLPASEERAELYKTNEEASKPQEGTGGVSSWNDLTDRPFYSETEVNYDESRKLTVKTTTQNTTLGTSFSLGLKVVCIFDDKQYVVTKDKFEGGNDYWGHTVFAAGSCPFYLTKFVTNESPVLHINPDGQEHTFTIYYTTTQETIQKLSGKYLSSQVAVVRENVPYSSDINRVVLSRGYSESVDKNTMCLLNTSQYTEALDAVYLRNATTKKVYTVSVNGEGQLVAEEVTE